MRRHCPPLFNTLFVAALAIWVSGCGQTTGPEDALAAKNHSIRVLPNNVVLEAGEAVKFTATVTNRHGKSVGKGGEIFWEATGGTIGRGTGHYVAGVTSGEYRVTARSENYVAGHATVVIVSADNETPTSELGQVATTIVVSPTRNHLQPGQQRDFTAAVRDQHGHLMSASVSWAATGGTITNETYTAGPRPGSYAVTATTSGLSASSRISISNRGPSSSGDPEDPQDPGEPPSEPEPPVSSSIQVSPIQVELQPDEQQIFTAKVLDQDGNLMSSPVSWTATGGTITSNGTYTAGSQGGLYSVTASSDELLASARISIVVPAPPSPPSGTPEGAIPIHPGESIQAVVDAHPEGTTFLIKAGIHSRQSVRPKDGMTFVGEAGAILDGDGDIRFAFVGHGNSSAPPSDNVTIRNLEVRNYDSPIQYGAIKAADVDVAKSGTGWLIEDCDIHHNSGGGIRTGHRMVIRGSYIHHNGQIGIAGQGDDILVEDNEIAFNNTRNMRITGGTSGEYGGTKFVKTRNLVIRNNYVHDNTEHGLWIDIDNVDTLIEDNRVIDNTGAGIFFEISYGAVIRNNYVEGNASIRGAIWHYSGIFVSSSRDVEIYGNTLVNNWNGITALSQPRGSGALGVHEVRNLYVHDNEITIQEGLTGLAEDVGDLSFFTSKNNRFENNTYHLGSRSEYFAWMRAERTEKEWQAYGQDVTGSFNR